MQLENAKPQTDKPKKRKLHLQKTDLQQCVNLNDPSKPHGEEETAPFYCLLEKVYLCEDCFEEHRSH